MVRIEVKPTAVKNSSTSSVWVEIENVSDVDLESITQQFDQFYKTESQRSDAIAKSFVYAINLCPKANPSDIWQHIIYRIVLDRGESDQQWKRIAGFALERAIGLIYDPRLTPHNIRLRCLKTPEAVTLLKKINLQGIVKPAKIDMILEGFSEDKWHFFAGIHVKASIAERIQDDVPASAALMAKGYVSLLLTMDSKSFPPPHGDGVNWGELGGRTYNNTSIKDRPKRAYIEEDGQFNALFSFNLRTPPSLEKTKSGKKIWTLGLNDPQPDCLVKLIIDEWKRRKESL